MRILHLWDQAGVAFILSKYQTLRGHQSNALMVKEYDKFGIGKFYREYIISTTLQEFVQKSIDEARSSDILHIHSRSDLVREFRKVFGKSKKIIIHYHGTDVRGIKNQKLPHRSRLSDIAVRGIFTYRRIKEAALFKKRIHSQAQVLADAVVVSTPDLMSIVPKAVHIPNPIDVGHFAPDGTVKMDKAITFDTEAIDIKLTLDHCKKNGLDFDIDVYNRIQNPIMYSDMPSFLKKYGTYIDIRYVDGVLLENLSKTALEALACGLDVIDYRIKRLQGLPTENEPVNVVSKLDSIYSGSTLKS
jgi:glycosyltransferase involved in cell wall biosynthesis